MNHMQRQTLTLSIMLVVNACTVTEVGNPKMDPGPVVDKLQLSFAATSSDPTIATLGAPMPSQTPKIRIDSVWIALSGVRFVRNAECDNDAAGTEIDLKQFNRVNLATNTANILPIALNADDYCRVRVRLDRAATNTADVPELFDHSLVIKGTRTDGTTITLQSQANDTIELRSKTTPFAISDAQRALLMSFDVATWFVSLDLTAASVTDGHIIINHDNNRDLLDAFEIKLHDSVRLLKDDNANGRIDDGDKESVLAEPTK